MNTLEEAKSKLDRDCLPPGVVEVTRPTELLFFSVKKDDHGTPTIGFYLQIAEDMSFDMWYVFCFTDIEHSN